MSHRAVNGQQMGSYTPFPAQSESPNWPLDNEVTYSYDFSERRDLHTVSAHKGGDEVGYIDIADKNRMGATGLKRGEIAMVQVYDQGRKQGIANHMLNEARAILHAKGIQVQHSENLTPRGRAWRNREPEKNPLSHEHGGVTHLRQNMLYDQPSTPDHIQKANDAARKAKGKR